MQRETLDIKQFGGIISNADPLDIPLEAASTSDMVDGDSPEGKLQGIPVYSDVTSTKTVYDASRSAWIKDSSNKWNLVYTNLTKVKVAKDFYGTYADSGIDVTANGYSFVVHNQECHVACGQSTEPQWVGYVSYAQLGGSTIGWVAENAKIPQTTTSSFTSGGVAVRAIAGSGTGTAFEASKTYTYRATAIYDYTQESPLDAYGTYGLSGANGYATHDVTITISKASSVSKRITGVNLYRSEQENAEPTNISLYRLIKSFDVTGALIHTGYTWASSVLPVAGSYQIVWSDDNTIVGNTYEQQSGIAETLTSSDLKYTLNTECNNYHFVAGCSKTEVPDASHMVFRSLPYRYDMFDWSAIGSFVRLKTQPSALVSFNNRVWAFDENNMYKINPDSMIVEETIFGIGCRSQRGILVTPYGMFWENASNAYWHDGQTLTTIGDAIKASSGEWHGFGTDFASDAQDERPIVVFVPAKNYVLFAIPYSTGTDVINVWAWHVIKKRWDKWSAFIPDCDIEAGMFTGKDGEVYACDGISKIYNALGGATTRACDWTSKELDLGNASQYKKIYKTLVDSSSTITLTNTLDGSVESPASSPISLTTAGVAGKKAKKIKTKIACDATETVTSLSYIFRRFAGNR